MQTIESAVAAFAPRFAARWIALVLLACAGLPQAQAARVANLYQITVTEPVGGQRAEALKLAMTQLLVKVTGSRQAAFDPRLAPMIENAEPYVNQYGRDLEGRPVVGFNASGVDEALAALDWPVWPQERPLTLLWVAVDNGFGERALLGANGAGGGASAAMTALLADIESQALAVADERGLPIALPLLDLEDLSAVTFTDVWGGFDDAINLASARYRPDALLIGRVRPGLFGAGTDVQCLLIRNGVRRSASGMTLRECLDAAGDVYAAEYSVVGGASTTTRITVQNVTTLADYGRVVSYLEGLDLLERVDVEGIDGGVLALAVAARGDSQVLERILALGGVLVPTAGDGGLASGPFADGLKFALARSGANP